MGGGNKRHLRVELRMMSSNDWRDKTDRELAQARRARKMGNEGMARVCARRAAGHIIAEYYRRIGNPPGSQDAGALKLIRRLSSDATASEQIRQVAGYFALNVTEEHTLPGEVDLLTEIIWLMEALLGEAENEKRDGN